MSQEKVDRYKEYKKNRKENLEKEKKATKRRQLIWKIVGCVVALALVVALGITIYNAVSTRIQARPDYDRTEFIVADVAGIYATEAETEAETTTADAETTAAPEGETTTAADK